ncbi:calcium-binding protein [Embleya sp. NPDC020886]|uniref:calcium-binding protein n=1 Tax=Embleya sp. NPDC020886 TaxID=3363980 RepID=UPI0037BBCF1F
MRVRAFTAALSGTLTICAFGVAPAHAGPLSPTTIMAVTVNNGQPIVVGTATKTVSAAVLGTNDSGIGAGIVSLWHGATDYTHRDATLSDPNLGVCFSPGALGHCTSTIDITPAPGTDKALYSNSLAGTWKVATFVWGNNHQLGYSYQYSTVQVLRQAKLSADAAPEPAHVGQTINVSGRLTRANWETGTDAGYANQPVKLQFHKTGSTGFVTLKTVMTGSGGVLNTTVEVSANGSYRFAFAGDATTSAVQSVEDVVNLD